MHHIFSNESKKKKCIHVVNTLQNQG